MKFFVDPHGCAKNQVDAEELIVRLEDAGHSEVVTAADADLVIVNSCGFVDSAKRESIEAVVSWKRSWPGKKVLLAGCLAQRYATELASGLPEADGIVGNADLAAAVLAVGELEAGGRPVIVPEAATSIGTTRRRRLLDWPGSAHIKVTEGCSNNCSYCAIPLIRGRLRSRPVAEVVAEIAAFLDRAAGGDGSGRGNVEDGHAPHEFILVGQDLGAYGRDLGVSGGILPDLLRGISRLEGDFRVRVLYVHPDNFPEGLLEAIAADKRMLHYLDLPFQHASRDLLKRMNRRGDADSYLRLIERIRSVLPDATLRSTFLLGFPGESEEDFTILREFQEAARLDWLGSFAYSREEGTAAYAMKGRVPKRVVEERRAAVETAQVRITAERLARHVGSEVEVLVEEGIESGDDGEAYSIGRAWMQAPEVDGLTVLRGEHRPGRVVRARVLAVAGVDLDAEALVHHESQGR